MPDFNGMTLLVTGAATGLGRAVATTAAELGAKVAVLDINEADGRATAAAVGGRFWRRSEEIKFITDRTLSQNRNERSYDKRSTSHYIAEQSALWRIAYNNNIVGIY